MSNLNVGTFEVEGDTFDFLKEGSLESSSVGVFSHMDPSEAEHIALPLPVPSAPGLVQMDLQTSIPCSPLPPENDFGNVEYKFKLVSPSEARLEHLVTQMHFRLTEGEGIAYYWIGVHDHGEPTGLSDQDLLASIHTLSSMALELGCDLFVTAVRLGSEGKVAHLCVKKIALESRVCDTRICCIGDADSGKSSLLGVLLTGSQDDGFVCYSRHRHELAHGSTSSMSRQLFGFHSDGSIVNQHSFSLSWPQIVRESSQLILFIDLAGFKRYMKTTLFGLTSQLPDYVLFTIACDQGGIAGDISFIEQQLEIISALSIPFFVVVTKIDLCSSDQVQAAVLQIQNMLQRLACPRSSFILQPGADCSHLVNLMLYEKEIPLVLSSAVRGDGFPALTSFLHHLYKPGSCDFESPEPFQFCIDEIYHVSRVGLVVSGIVLNGVVSVGDQVYLGPFSSDFQKVVVQSIEIFRTPVKRAHSGQLVSIALGRIGSVRKGMFLVDPRLEPLGSWRLEAEILLLGHQGEIQVQNEPVLHFETVRQSAKIVSITKRSHSSESMSAGETGRIVFHFCHSPEYVRAGVRVIMKQGNVVGVGTISTILKDDEERALE